MRKLIGNASPLTRLPKKNEQDEVSADASPKKIMTPTNRPTQNPMTASKSTVKPATASSNNNSLFGPRFWTVASVISLTINGVSLLALIITAIMLLSYGLSISTLLNMGNGLLGGLYTNFEKMDRASIQTNVEVNTTIPVKFDLQLNQQTNVV
ncbi:MAG: hypothetical protein HC797_02000 [Anaerolineales bacterium]|nr:hypothetical protein [Anaerolineales bacterium]